MLFQRRKNRIEVPVKCFCLQMAEAHRLQPEVVNRTEDTQRRLRPGRPRRRPKRPSALTGATKVAPYGGWPMLRRKLTSSFLSGELSHDFQKLGTGEEDEGLSLLFHAKVAEIDQSEVVGTRGGIGDVIGAAVGLDLLGQRRIAQGIA